MGGFRTGFGLGILLILGFVFLSWITKVTDWNWLWWAIPLSPIILLVAIFIVAKIVAFVLGIYMRIREPDTWETMQQAERDIAAGNFDKRRNDKTEG